MVRVDVVRVLIREQHAEQEIRLREQGGEREFPIVVGVFEAAAIDRIYKGIALPRPLTHDLFASLLTQLDAELTGVLIDDVDDGLFYAKLQVTRADGAAVTIDARPSDAIAIALRQDVPIHVTDTVMNAACAA